MRASIYFSLTLGLATIPRVAASQESESVGHFGLAVGATRYDFNSTGYSAIVSARLDFVVKPWLLLQQGFSYFNYQPPTINRTHLLFSDTQVQLQVPGSVRPFLGAGVGGASDVGRALGQQFTLSASAGARITVRRAWNAMVEFRMRSVDPFENSTRDWLFGISKEIGRRDEGN